MHQLKMRRVSPNRRYLLFFACVAWALILGLPQSLRASDSNDTSNSILKNENIHIEKQTNCLNEAQLTQALSSVLEGHPQKRALMSVIASDIPTETATNVHLRVIMKRTGEISLDRHFSLSSTDCGSAAKLLSLVLEQFLADFSVAAWKAENDPDGLPPDPVPARVEKKTVEKNNAKLAGLVFVGANLRWVTPGVDFELGLALDTGTAAHRLIAGGIYRGSVPRKLGSGRYMENMFLLTVGWQYAASKVVVRTEVRVGADLISGFGYSTNYNKWNLQLELNGAILFRLGTLRLGPQFGVSPIRRNIYTALGPEEELPNFRAGVVVGKSF